MILQRIKRNCQPVAATVTLMTTATGHPLHQSPTLLDNRNISESKLSICARYQPGMGNVFPVRQGIAAMTVRALTSIHIVGLMA